MVNRFKFLFMILIDVIMLILLQCLLRFSKNTPIY